MSDAKLLELVRQMREAQRRWFKEHDRAALGRSKQLEAEVDKALAARL